MYNGFDELDAIAPFEVLQMAARQVADLRVDFVTLDGATEVVAQHGSRLQVSRTLDETANLILVPGGGWVARAKQGAWAEAQRGTIPDALAKLHQQGKLLASVCTGAMLLATAGLLRGRNATTHHNALQELSDSGAQLQNARVVDDGDIITSGGVTSGLDLTLWLTERFYGSSTAIAIEQNLEYERRGTVWKRHV